MNDKKMESKIEENLQQWKYFGLYPIIIPVIFLHVLKWIIIGNVDVYQLLMDFLFMAFSFAMSAFEIIANGSYAEIHKNKIFPMKYRTVVGGLVFMLLNIAYQCMKDKDIDACYRHVALVVFCIIEVGFICYTYWSGKRAIIWKIEDRDQISEQES